MSSEMRTKITQFEQTIYEKDRRIAEFENKIAILNQEIERLNVNLRKIVDENSGLDQQLRSARNDLENAQRKVGQMEGSITNEYRVKISTFEQKITVISQENEELRVRVNSLAQFEAKCGEFGREI